MNDDAILDPQMINAWQVAAEDLGIDVVAPFVLRVDGAEVRFEVLVKEFGGSNGMLLDRRMGATGTGPGRIYGLGYWVLSVLGTNHTEYDRSSFIDELNCWGWNGDLNAAPDWYSGESPMIC
jgi:hypothetical protein